MSGRLDLTEIPETGNRWGFFARDFLVELGFRLDSPLKEDDPNGTIFLATEQVRGKFNTYPFRWLVSCQHRHALKTQIRESEEATALETLSEVSVDGFLGVYSVLPAPGLIKRLREAQKDGSIKAFRFFELQMLDNYIRSRDFTPILKRYFPVSYENSNPTQILQTAYVPLSCEYCGKDLLSAMYREEQPGVVTWVREKSKDELEPTVVHDLYFACCGRCDEMLQEQYCREPGFNTSAWISLDQLVISPVFLDRLLTFIDRLIGSEYRYSERAFEKEKLLIRSIAQKVFRSVSETEKQKLASAVFTLEQ